MHEIFFEVIYLLCRALSYLFLLVRIGNCLFKTSRFGNLQQIFILLGIPLHNKNPSYATITKRVEASDFGWVADWGGVGWSQSLLVSLLLWFRVVITPRSSSFCSYTSVGNDQHLRRLSSSKDVFASSSPLTKTDIRFFSYEASPWLGALFQKCLSLTKNLHQQYGLGEVEKWVRIKWWLWIDCLFCPSSAMQW